MNSTPHTPGKKPDVIALVKELQAKHDAQTYLYCPRNTASDMPEHRFVGPMAIHVENLYNHFPSIAQTLLTLSEENTRLREENVKMKAWIKKNCTEEGCEEEPDPECWSCQALAFLSSLHQ